MLIDGEELPSVAAGNVLSSDIDMLSSVDMLGNRLLGSLVFFFFLILVESLSDLNNTISNVIQSKSGGEIKHKDNI